MDQSSNIIKSIRHRLGNIKRLAFRVYESLFVQFEIDGNLIKKAIQDFHLDKTTAQLKECYGALPLLPSDNNVYFDNLLTYVGADKFLPTNPFFLYPSNVAVIDFLLKNVNKTDSILDYGCGLGNLQVYLRQLGFINSFGYDNFAQINRSTIENFLHNFNLSQILLSKQKALVFETNVVICVEYWWHLLSKDLKDKEINNPNVEYILIESRCAPRYIKNFKIMGVYKDLLIVFKRL